MPYLDPTENVRPVLGSVGELLEDLVREQRGHAAADLVVRVLVRVGVLSCKQERKRMGQCADSCK